jgi:hypothetical protein
VRVFISYRRADAALASVALADGLQRRAERVFLDTRDVASGAEWRNQLLHEVRDAHIVLVVIGPRWSAASQEQARRGLGEHAGEDVLRLEIETAFKLCKPVVPVLVDGAAMPPREALARPFRPLADLQAEVLHRETWDRDVQALADDLEKVLLRTAPPPPPTPRARDAPREGARKDTQRIAAYMAEGSVVTVLGPGTHCADRSSAWEDGAPCFPDDRELARLLAARFGVGTGDDDLPRVSEHVAVMDGRRDLCRALRRVLAQPDAVPDSVQRFVAGVPRGLAELGRERHQLVVTTTYDTSLERAFDLVHEPYDLVVFVAGGDHRGRFVHVPWWDPENGGPKPIVRPNEYLGLPIEEDGDLTRTVILKLNGGLADIGPGWELRDNFVVTEDDLIGYLADGPVADVVPVQILEKVRDSHFLFLGYSMRGWGPRVFPRRLLGERLEARSWAVGSGIDDVERELWEDFGVDVVEEPLASYVLELGAELGRVAPLVR